MQNSRFNRCICLLAALIMTVTIFVSVKTVSAQTPQPPSPAYEVIDLGAFGNGASAAAISQDGSLVAGSFSQGFGNRAFLWRGGVFTDLSNTLGTPFSFASDVNDQGNVVGVSIAGTEAPTRAFAIRDNAVVPLSPLFNVGESRANSINNLNQIAGVYTPAGGQRAYFYDLNNGTLKTIGTLGGSSSSASDINLLGEIVGTSSTGVLVTDPNGSTNIVQRAFFWDAENGLRNLGALGGSFSRANAVNERGQAVGISTVSSNGNLARPVLWEFNGTIVDLGELAPGTTTGAAGEALDINNRGQVVGWSYTPAGNRAFLWTRQNGLRDLNTLLPAGSGWVLNQASAISSNGGIVGSGRLTVNGTSVNRSFLLRPLFGQSLFLNQTPQLPDATDGRSYELGLKFQSNTNGKIVAIRYWKSPSETGTHTGRLWTADGTLLATVEFTNETVSGWQQARLSEAVPVAAMTTYVVSVNTNTHYADTYDILATPNTSGNLATIADGNNGVFGDIGTLPTNSYRNSSYFRDVVFVPEN